MQVLDHTVLDIRLTLCSTWSKLETKHCPWIYINRNRRYWIEPNKALYYVNNDWPKIEHGQLLTSRNTCGIGLFMYSLHSTAKPPLNSRCSWVIASHLVGRCDHLYMLQCQHWLDYFMLVDEAPRGTASWWIEWTKSNTNKVIAVRIWVLTWHKSKYDSHMRAHMWARVTVQSAHGFGNSKHDWLWPVSFEAYRPAGCVVGPRSRYHMADTEPMIYNIRSRTKLMQINTQRILYENIK